MGSNAQIQDKSSRFGIKILYILASNELSCPLSSPILSTLCSMHYFLFPNCLIYLIFPYPNTIIFSNLKCILLPQHCCFLRRVRLLIFYDVSFNSKYLLIIFVQGTALGIWERRINRRGTVPTLTKLLKNEEHHTGNDNNVFPHCYPQQSKSRLRTQKGHYPYHSFDK